MSEQSPYFLNCQKWKEHILADARIMQTLSEHVRKGKRLEHISEGNQNQIFRVGQLSSDIWVAVRERMGNTWDPDVRPIPNCYEEYIERAVSLADRGYRVPSFCIGLLGKRYTGLLVEDITQGGKRKINSGVGDETVTFADTDEEVFLDLDNDVIHRDEFFYMDDRHCIVID